MERVGQPIIVYVDTHIVTRMAEGLLGDLNQEALHLLDEGRLFYSPMVGLELQYLYQINRINTAPEVLLEHLWKTACLQVSEIPFSQIALKARSIDWTRDPFDRIITAEVMLVPNAYLITKDQQILKHFDRALY